MYVSCTLGNLFCVSFTNKQGSYSSSPAPKSLLQFSPINPKPYLRDLVNKSVAVTLKFNRTQYRGVLVSTDNYFNLQLRDTHEYVADEHRGAVGDIFIRCNNVLWVGEDKTKANEQHN